MITSWHFCQVKKRGLSEGARHPADVCYAPTEAECRPARGLSKWAYIVSVAVSVPIALSLLPAQKQSTPYHCISAGMKSGRYAQVPV